VNTTEQLDASDGDGREENRRLKHTLAESMLDVRALKAVLSKKVVDLQAKREAVRVAMAEAGLSQRRACRLIPLWRGTLRYQAKRPASERRACGRPQLPSRLLRPPAIPAGAPLRYAPSCPSAWFSSRFPREPQQPVFSTSRWLSFWVLGHQVSLR
jgi:hypothetical protein